MVFSSITFLFYFLPIVLMIYYIVPNRLKNIVLLISSLIFYAYGEPKFVVIMVLSIICTYVFAIYMDKYKKHAKVFLTLSVLLSVGVLVYFKYFNFLVENINLWLTHKLDFIYVALPIGISFYTFQLMSYIIDVYRGETKVQRSLIKLATYIALFPQLIAGPIVRYSTIAEQLDERKCSAEKFAQGVRRFVIGLGKKILIANVLGELVNIFLSSNDNSTLFYILYSASNMLQIYFDFSGYSDMAIGLGKMFGFEFLENFNYPYIAKSVTEFWRRWHISLGSWFRDYIYIPLGGNRVSKLKWIRNILAVWLLTGFWHGADWNFALWGVYFGIILVLEKIFLGKVLQKLPKFISNIYVLIIVMISFIIFSSNSTLEITNNLGGLFGITSDNFASQESIYYFKSYLVILIISIIGATELPKNIASSNKLKKITNILEPAFLLLILVISTSYIVDGSFNPFLYFRF